MSTVELNGQTYLIGRLEAIKQFHVTRRLTPLLAASGDRLLKAGEKEPEWGEMLVALADALAHMSDADAEFIIETCLGVVQRKVMEGKYQPVRTGGRWLYEDIDMQAMLRLTSEVIKENLGDFFEQLIGAFGLPISLSQSEPQPESPASSSQ